MKALSCSSLLNDLFCGVMGGWGPYQHTVCAEGRKTPLSSQIHHRVSDQSGHLSGLLHFIPKILKVTWTSLLQGSSGFCVTSSDTHNLTHVWHIFHMYEDKHIPQSPTSCPSNSVKLFHGYLLFPVLQIIWLLLTCWTSLCKWFTTYGSCKLSGQLVELDG